MGVQFASIIATLSLILSSLTGLTGLVQSQPVVSPDIRLGADIPQVVALFETSLASRIGKADTAMTLVSGKDRSGADISGYIGFIIDEGTASQEFVAGNASGTSIIGLLRGINPTTGNTTSSALAFEHRRGASVKITTFPVLGVITRQLNGEETIPHVLSYDPAVTTSTFTTSSQVINKGYSDYQDSTNVHIAGNETITGLKTFSVRPKLSTDSDTTSTADFISYGQLARTSFAGGIKSNSSTVGVSALSLDPVSSTFPISVGDNDPRVNTLAGTSTLGRVKLSSSPSSSTNPVALNAEEVATTSAVNVIPRVGANGVLDPSFLPSTAKFGGTGADGALNISSGTTTIDLGGASLVVKNYTGISITGTGKLTFSNPATNGTIVILKSQGNVTLTSSQAPMIDMGGNGASVANTGFGITLFTTANASGQSGAAGAMKFTPYVNRYYPLPLFTGGAGSAGAGAEAGAGGRGGGGLLIECGGAWNFTTLNGISVAGATGSNGLNGASGVRPTGAGGGGGAGGSFVALYKSLTANTGTVIFSGGNGGATGLANGTNYSTTNAGGGGGASAWNVANGSNGSGGSGAAGGAGGNAISGGSANGGNGGNYSGQYAGSGGGGASGYYYIGLNTEF